MLKQPNKILYLLYHDKCNNSEREIFKSCAATGQCKEAMCVCVQLDIVHTVLEEFHIVKKK
jgi:hypothetical protein